MAPKKKIISNRHIMFRPEPETVDDVSKELDEYKRATDEKLKSLQTQINELREKLADIERFDE